MIGGRHAAIDRLLHDDFLDVVGGKSAFDQSRAHVQPELRPFVERNQRADHKNAARAVVEMRTLPKFAPGIARDEFLELGS
jgi:hypothetical protein